MSSVIVHHWQTNDDEFGTIEIVTKGRDDNESETMVLRIKHGCSVQISLKRPNGNFKRVIDDSLVTRDSIG